MEFRLPIRFPDPKWIASGQTEQFCGYEIPGPICVRDNFEIDAPGFFIDPKLPIVDGKAELLPADDGADDYSKYKPSRRGRYLRWRVEGRPPNIANGNSIAFLQQDFWPFEWRLLAQGDTDPKLVLALVDFVAQHTEAMIKTGLGLLANRLLHLVTLRLGAVPQLNLIQSLRCLPAVMWGREEVGLMLSTHERFNVPLAADLAALVAGILASPGEREVILKRSSEFRGVFIPSFNEHYPRGLKVQRPVDRCSFHCTPRHPDTQQEITARGIDTRFEIGDFFKDPSQFQGLMDVCRMALTKLGRDPRPVAAGVVGSPRPRSTTNHQSKGRFDEVTVRPAGTSNAGETIEEEVLTNSSQPKAASRSKSVAPTGSKIDADALQVAMQKTINLAAIMSEVLSVGSTQAPELPLSEDRRIALLAAWGRGVTPPEYACALHVGRGPEILQIKQGIAQIEAGHSWFQIIIGANGSGKSHLQKFCEQAAITLGLVVARVELTPQIRLHGTNGEAKALISRLFAHLKLKGAAAGEGLEHILDALLRNATGAEKITPKQLPQIIQRYCKKLLSMRGGDDLVEAIIRYCQARLADDLSGQTKALRWLRAEYQSASQARKDLGVGGLVGDGDFLNHLKSMATLCRLAGFKGLLVLVDELTILTRNLHGTVRQPNFDVILNAIDDSSHGVAPGLGLVLAGTPDCLDANQRGLLFYPALRSRLQPDRINFGEGKRDHSGPVMVLDTLQPAELVVLLQKARAQMIGPSFSESRLPDVALVSLVEGFLDIVGADQFLSPREVLKTFAQVVQSLDQSADLDWQTVLGVVSQEVNGPNGTATEIGGIDSGPAKILQNFKL